MDTAGQHPPTQTIHEQSPESWLRLSHVPGISSRYFNALLATFGCPEAILGASQRALVAAGVKPALAQKVANAGNGNLTGDVAKQLAASLKWLEHEQHWLLTRQCAGYPELLTEIPDPPPVLYIKGNPALLQVPMLAIVGSRNPTAGGRRNACHFAHELAAAGIGIVSGLALGVDVASHEGALMAKGVTAAVLGTGADRIYPAGNRTVFERMSEEAVLLSEFCPGTPPIPANFPRRNRIISGMSAGVLVVEASLRSGSMITARFALEQGREVFAIPGSIHNPMAKGCHRLIADGAKLVECVEDILEECPALRALPLPHAENRTTGNPHDMPLQGEIKVVKEAIGFDPVSLDTLVRATGLDVQQTTVALQELELMNIIQKENSGYVLAAP